MLASAVDLTKLQINKELNASQDHSSTVDALVRETSLDINAFHAQLDKLLTQITSMSALSNQHAVTSISDSQEILLTVVDANHANSQEKSQIKPELDVSKDH